MKNYRVTVDGVAYDVTVEELSETTAPAVSAAPAAPAAPKAAAPVAKEKSAPAGAVAVKAPMPGTVIKINVKNGDAVKKGDVLCVLEAMKMENDIMAPADGTVASVEVARGAQVATDALLITLN